MNTYDSWHRGHQFINKRIFVDTAHNPQGQICNVFYDSELGRYIFESIKEKK